MLTQRHFRPFDSASLILQYMAQVYQNGHESIYCWLRSDVGHCAFRQCDSSESDCSGRYHIDSFPNQDVRWSTSRSHDHEIEDHGLLSGLCRTFHRGICLKPKLRNGTRPDNRLTHAWNGDVCRRTRESCTSASLIIRIGVESHQLPSDRS